MSVDVLDLVMLHELTEDALLENLKTRFGKDEIYTYIGDVVIVVNPYKNIAKFYNDEAVETYRNREKFEVEPHVYSIADGAYRALVKERHNQCIIISGESGAGKTVASKHVMSYIAAVSGSGTSGDKIKDQLLNSNPLLEAFGNAKTLRNTNSSRFGKYCEIEFDFKGTPVGGRITNYLLEKSRVVHPCDDERSFHIFYQLLAGADDSLLAELKLNRDPHCFKYLTKSGCVSAEGIDDSVDFKATCGAMDILGFTEEDKNMVFRVVAAVTHLGNLEFEAVSEEESKISSADVLDVVASLLSVSAERLAEALTHRTITTPQGGPISIPLNLETANYARDALAKSLYDRLFVWVVQKINQEISCKDSHLSRTTMGILDIYGFEVLQTNSLEQFCINYTNEKLQQLFVELTLKSEQEEYAREGIEWVPVDYFNNQIICDLIEKKPSGIIALMDQECTLGNLDDLVLVEKMNEQFQAHEHYVYEKHAVGTRRAKGADEPEDVSDRSFTLKHYAGDVTYYAPGFLDKNKDQLFTDLVHCIQASTTAGVPMLYPEDVSDQKRRPPCAATQFKSQVNNLMKNLLACGPHYIRCIKPNGEKAAELFDLDLVTHQARYLGLMENVRVRRAGFAYRAEYARMCQRYKMLCPTTWPLCADQKAGVEAVLQHLAIDAEEFRMGKTKCFIRTPQTIHMIEGKRDVRKVELVTKIQAVFRGFAQWKLYQRYRRGAVLFQAAYRRHVARERFLLEKRSQICLSRHCRGYQARTRYQQQRRAAITIQAVYKGHAQCMLYQRQKSGAVTMQRVARGFLCRRNIEAIREEARLEKIRYQEEQERKRYAAATKIAAAYRGHVRQREYCKTRTSTLLVQRIARHYLKRVFLSGLAEKCKGLKDTDPFPQLKSADIPPRFHDSMEGLKVLYRLNAHRLRCIRIAKYKASLSTKRKQCLFIKMVASDIFLSNGIALKSSYSGSVGTLFKGEHQSQECLAHAPGCGKVRYIGCVDIINKAFKAEPAILVITNIRVLLLHPKKFKVLQQYEVPSLTYLRTSILADNYVVIGVPADPKGKVPDLVLNVRDGSAVEVAAWVCEAYMTASAVGVGEDAKPTKFLPTQIASKVTYRSVKNAECYLQFEKKEGVPENSLTKNKGFATITCAN